PEIRARFEGDPPLPELSAQRRAFAVEVGGEKRWVAAEDAARLRDGLDAGVPADLPRELLESVKDPLGDLVSRWARTHGPCRAGGSTRCSQRWSNSRERRWWLPRWSARFWRRACNP